jgi:hypothetical protein
LLCFFQDGVNRDGSLTLLPEAKLSLAQVRFTIGMERSTERDERSPFSLPAKQNRHFRKIVSVFAFCIRFADAPTPFLIANFPSVRTGTSTLPKIHHTLAHSWNARFIIGDDLGTLDRCFFYGADEERPDHFALFVGMAGNCPGDSISSELRPDVSRRHFWKPRR